MVTVPVFLTRNDQVILSPRLVLPSPLTSVTAADLVSCSALVCTTGVEVEELLEVTVAAAGLLAVAVAVLLTTPVSTSGWVIVYAAEVQVVDAPGARVVTGQVIAPALASVTAVVLSVTVPVFLTRNDQAIVSPRSVLPSPLTSVTAADLVSCNDEAWSTGVEVEEGLEVTRRAADSPSPSR